MIRRGVARKRGCMQGSVFKQWYGSKRFTVGLILLVTVLLLTLGVAIYSYVAAYTAVTNYSALNLEASLIQPTQKQSELSSPSSDPVNNTSSVTNENGGSVDASISTNSNETPPSVVVNGTPITVPENGSTQQQVTSDDGTATVNVQVHSDSSTSDSSRTHSNLHLNLYSSSTTRSDGE